MLPPHRHGDAVGDQHNGHERAEADKVDDEAADRAGAGEGVFHISLLYLSGNRPIKRQYAISGVSARTNVRNFAIIFILEIAFPLLEWRNRSFRGFGGRRRFLMI